MPASSAICASFRLFSQEASQRSGTFVTAMPPEQLGEKMPSLSLLSLNIVVRGSVCGKDMTFPRFIGKRGLYADGDLNRIASFNLAGAHEKPQGQEADPSTLTVNLRH